MRVTDNRYSGEIDKFELALRLIRHEARTGTIRACTGFSEDRIRKLVLHYFERAAVRRRRGKTPRQIGRFVGNATRQAEATVLACCFVHSGALWLEGRRRCRRPAEGDLVETGHRLCAAFETYRDLHPAPALSFEWAWNLYHALVDSGELYLAICAGCSSPYVQDRYALDYARCPFCELKEQLDPG